MNLMRSLYCLLVLALIGCGGGRDLPYIYESEVNEKNPVSFSQVAIYHLESPADVAIEEDSGGIGSDTIHFSEKSAKPRMFCLALEEGKNHRAQIFSDSNVDYISIDRQNSCTTIRTDSGRVKISIFHDGVSSAENIFIHEAGASGRALLAKESTSDPITIISATGCPSCNLANADLSNRDLHQMDFSDANLLSANFSNSNLTSADLLNADLTNISTDGAILSRTIWSDGNVCSSSSVGICDPFIFTVQANVAWQETEVLLKKDRVANFTAFGTWSVSPSLGFSDAGGFPFAPAKQSHSLPGAPEGALIGRIGNSVPFLVGIRGSRRAESAGSVSLVINEDLNGIYGPGLRDNLGEVRVGFSIGR